MPIKAEIIADSLNVNGDRLTSFVLEYPRFVHAEFMTHRVLSKNAASSRAIPIDKMIQQVLENPAMPVWWGKTQSGMQAEEELDDSPYYDSPELVESGVLHEATTAWYSGMGKRKIAEIVWLNARNMAVQSVRFLDKIGLHKQISNRILEPWFNIRVICSGTDYENFFALRAHKDAQPEIKELAFKMLEAYNLSTPKFLKPGEWHIPFGDKIDGCRIQEIQHTSLGLNQTTEDLKKKIAIARCARVSYFNFEGKDDYVADVKLCERLFGGVPRHSSPAEHVAEALDTSERIGNFKGFKQYRKIFSDENLKDPRVKRWVPLTLKERQSVYFYKLNATGLFWELHPNGSESISEQRLDYVNIPRFKQV